MFRELPDDLEKRTLSDLLTLLEQHSATVSVAHIYTKNEAFDLSEYDDQGEMLLSYWDSYGEKRHGCKEAEDMALEDVVSFLFEDDFRPRVLVEVGAAELSRPRFGEEGKLLGYSVNHACSTIYMGLGNTLEEALMVALREVSEDRRKWALEQKQK